MNKFPLRFHRKSCNNLATIFQRTANHLAIIIITIIPIHETTESQDDPPSFPRLKDLGKIPPVLAIGNEVAVPRRRSSRVECTEGSGSGRILSANKIKGPDLADSSRPRYTRRVCVRGNKSVIEHPPPWQPLMETRPCVGRRSTRQRGCVSRSLPSLLIPPRTVRRLTFLSNVASLSMFPTLVVARIQAWSR